MHWGAGRALIVVLAVAIGLALAAGGCGGSSSAAGTETSEAEFTLGRSKEFLGPNKENKQAQLGKEGTLAELEQVAQIVEESIQARSEFDWKGQCETLSRRGLEVVAEVAGVKKMKRKECPAKLAPAASEAPAYIIRNNMEGPVAAFRFAGNAGVALYHGNDQKDWAMPMQKEGGEWRVAKLAAEELKR
jgi:hypothetical protein